MKILLCLLLFPPYLLATGTFTLNQIMSAPFASAPVASPTGAKVAWLENEQGKRNVYVAAAPDWKAKRITNFAKDDGQEIAELAWAPDASYLLFVRGGDLETGGDNPNPDLNSITPEQEIWSAAADAFPVGSAVKKLTVGQAPAVSPTGGLVAFLKGGQIFTMQPNGEDVKNVVTQKGHAGDLRWSHDGQSLAFTTTRPGHTLIAIYSLADKSLRYLDPSTDHDAEPVWSPDDTHLAYLRIPSVSPVIGPAPEREGEPWSIRVVDVKTGVARSVFRAADGTGSVFHAIAATQQVLWADGDQLVFPWERTGWCHLYTFPLHGDPARGGTPVELTPGEGEVEDVSLSADRKTVYFNSNIGDIDGRHLWSVALPGGPAKQLTGGERIDWAPTPLSDGSALFFLSSSFNRKAHPMLRIQGKEKNLADELIPADFPAASLVKPQAVTIVAADGLRIHGQLFLPPDARSGERRPALAFFHGGSRRQMLLGFHYMYYYSNSYAMNQFLASQGYVVLSVNYRSGIGYGMPFREALNYGARGGSEYNDVVGAGLYLKNRADVDPARIGLWGGSYGGYLTAMGLSRASDLFAAGVDFHGVHDWSSLRDVTGTPPAGGDPKAQREYREALRLAFESSPMATVDSWKSPVLLIHGDDDRNVSFAQTEVLAEALRARHVEFEELIFPNEIHDFLRHDHWLEAYQATAAFFARKLNSRTGP
jgi:dipeptidyl aminopeptidase/acylaminoacyl peptidase